MRKLLNSEKEFINKILRLKTDGNIGELQSAKLLREQLNCIALKWTICPEKTLSIYYSEENGNSAFYDIVDYLYFVKELEDNQYISLLSYSNLEQNKERTLFDREKIGYCNADELDKDSLLKLFNSYNEDHFYYQKSGDTVFPIPRKEKLNIDIIDLLEKYAMAIIYPLPLLKEFKDNKYRSLEQKQFDSMRNRAIIANVTAIMAVIISILINLICG